MFYNMILLMTGHYQNYVLGKINAWSRVRSQPIYIVDIAVLENLVLRVFLLKNGNSICNIVQICYL